MDIAETSYLASLAKEIIAIRCGFCELLASLKNRNKLHVLYPTFRTLSAYNFYKTYTLKKYPFVNIDSIYEYVVNNADVDDILNKISER